MTFQAESHFDFSGVANRVLMCLLLTSSLSCSGVSTVAREQPAHGRISDLSAVEGDLVLCSHRVPASVCTRHHPELEPNFKKVGDWCSPHEVPESQCLVCHPDLTFRALPTLPDDADVQYIAAAGEDIGDLALHAVPGKVTVFEFYADWCAACLKVDSHLHRRFIDGSADFALRKLNVVNWESPLGKRYLRDVPGLPLLIVYRADGTPANAIYGADLELLDQTISSVAPASP